MPSQWRKALIAAERYAWIIFLVIAFLIEFFARHPETRQSIRQVNDHAYSATAGLRWFGLPKHDFGYMFWGDGRTCRLTLQTGVCTCTSRTGQTTRETNNWACKSDEFGIRNFWYSAWN